MGLFGKDDWKKRADKARKQFGGLTDKQYDLQIDADMAARRGQGASGSVRQDVASDLKEIYAKQMEIFKEKFQKGKPAGSETKDLTQGWKNDAYNVRANAAMRETGALQAKRNPDLAESLRDAGRMPVEMGDSFAEKKLLKEEEE